MKVIEIGNCSICVMARAGKRAKPTYTDPEDDRMTDSSLPIGSTSKTYDPERWQLLAAR